MVKKCKSISYTLWFISSFAAFVGIILSIIVIFFEIKLSGILSQVFWDNIITLIYFVISSYCSYTIVRKRRIFFKFYYWEYRYEKEVDHNKNNNDGGKDDDNSETRNINNANIENQNVVHLTCKSIGRICSYILSSIILIATLILRIILNIWDHNKFVKNSDKPVAVVAMNMTNIVLLNLSVVIIFGFYVLSMANWTDIWFLFHTINEEIKKFSLPIKANKLHEIRLNYQDGIRASKDFDDIFKYGTAGFLTLLFTGIIITVRRIGLEMNEHENFSYTCVSSAYACLLFIILFFTMYYLASINSECDLTMYLFKMFASDGNSTNTNSEFDDEV
jgi:hypothetical protein